MPHGRWCQTIQLRLAAFGEAAIDPSGGKRTVAGYWAPVWSPDGQRLAITSTRDGNGGLWIWDKASGSLQLTSARAVEYRAGRSRFSKPVWLSNTRLLYARFPARQRPVGCAIQVQSPEIAIAQWRHVPGAVSNRRRASLPAVSTELAHMRNALRVTWSYSMRSREPSRPSPRATSATCSFAGKTLRLASEAGRRASP
jgi:hypothetical protein